LASKEQELNDFFQEKTKIAARLEASLNAAEATLKSATQLLGQLSGENQRWSIEVGKLKQALDQVPIHSLVSSAYLTYLGGANETLRQ
jgi:hypothetical protein